MTCGTDETRPPDSGPPVAFRISTGGAAALGFDSAGRQIAAWSRLVKFDTSAPLMGSVIELFHPDGTALWRDAVPAGADGMVMPGTDGAGPRMLVRYTFTDGHAQEEWIGAEELPIAVEV